jgi:hypothetical protein
MLQQIYSKEMLGLCQRGMLAKTLESNYELLLPGCAARSVGLENWSLRKAATLQDTTCLQYCVILACLCTLQNMSNSAAKTAVSLQLLQTANATQQAAMCSRKQAAGNR